jgi:serine/threonine protein kinase
MSSLPTPPGVPTPRSPAEAPRASSIGSPAEAPRASSIGSPAEAPRASSIGSPAEAPRASTPLPRLPFPPSIPPESAYSNPDVDTNLRIGDLLEGRYQVEGPLGEGGVGIVYRALQLKLHRRVAVKLLQHEVIGEEELRPRFQQEALTLAALSHPNIVTLQDYGVVRGRPYLVMELLEGRTLRQIIDTEAAIAPLRTLSLLRQVLLALAYAHEFGVVHRDLKPANLIVQALPAYEHVKVLDFGMVKLMPGSHLHRGEQLTRQGFTFGTPAYMSPEHAVGGEVDMRSDLYSVGVLLFELLTGQKPFDGEVQDVLRHHLNTPVPRLTERRPELAELSELQALLDKAMAKEPSDRFANAREMLTAIDELLTSGMLAEPVPDAHGESLTLSQLAPKLRETLETAATALSGYARSGREVWRDKASPQLLRAQRELRAAAARLAPKLRTLSESAWEKLRPQLVRAVERVAQLALEARSRVETRLHAGHAALSDKPPLALPTSTQQADEPASTQSPSVPPAARQLDVPASARQPSVPPVARQLGVPASARQLGVPAPAQDPGVSGPTQQLGVPAATQQVDISELEEVLDAHFAAKAATIIDQPRFDPDAVDLAASDTDHDDGSHTAEPLTLQPRPSRTPVPVERAPLPSERAPLPSERAPLPDERSEVPSRTSEAKSRNPHKK